MRSGVPPALAVLLAVLPAPMQIDFARLKEGLGGAKVELASEEDFRDQFPECEVGAMPPFGNLYGMPVFADEHLAADEEITDSHVRNIPTATPDEGVGIVEAPRGTLTHHFVTDSRGIIRKANLIVGTTNNYAPISISIKKAAEAFIKKGQVISEGILNRLEMAFRSYDPCFGCATHTLPGQMPLEIRIRDWSGTVVKALQQHLGET